MRQGYYLTKLLRFAYPLGVSADLISLEVYAARCMRNPTGDNASTYKLLLAPRLWGKGSSWHKKGKSAFRKYSVQELI